MIYVIRIGDYESYNILATDNFNTAYNRFKQEVEDKLDPVYIEVWGRNALLSLMWTLDGCTYLENDQDLVELIDPTPKDLTDLFKHYENYYNAVT